MGTTKGCTRTNGQEIHKKTQQGLRILGGPQRADPLRHEAQAWRENNPQMVWGAEERDTWENHNGSEHSKRKALLNAGQRLGGQRGNEKVSGTLMIGENS